MWRPFKGPWTSLRTQAAEKLHALHRTEILDDAGATFMCHGDAPYSVHSTGQPCAEVIFSERFGGQTPYMVITQAGQLALALLARIYALQLLHSSERVDGSN